MRVYGFQFQERKEEGVVTIGPRWRLWLKVR